MLGSTISSTHSYPERGSLPRVHGWGATARRFDCEFVHDATAAGAPLALAWLRFKGFGFADRQSVLS
jgi:hypothetical protein